MSLNYTLNNYLNVTQLVRTCYIMFVNKVVLCGFIYVFFWYGTLTFFMELLKYCCSIRLIEIREHSDKNAEVLTCVNKISS